MFRCLSSIGLAVLLSAPLIAQATHASKDVQIRWTSYGIPHIRAVDERGLGRGIGYAYARDNACLLAESIITARGERSYWFGAEGKSPEGLENLQSDLFYTWLNSPKRLYLFQLSQPREIRNLLTGYSEGFNRYLREEDTSRTQCSGQPWLRAITPDDLVRLFQRMLVEEGLFRFAPAIVEAAPPGHQRPSWDSGYIQSRMENFHRDRGSNAIAVGRQRSVDGAPMLLGNPHFPWYGPLRFWQMHLTIPGKLDVMGASLPGIPMVNIGFSRSLAWTHTVDNSQHKTFYRLELDPKIPTRYRVDGRYEHMTRNPVSIRVRQPSGKVVRQVHNIYESRFGPVLAWPKGGLDWSKYEAWAIRDANLENTRLLQQWYAINQANNVNALYGAVKRLQGLPWINTLAVDDHGRALYMNQSVVPRLTSEQLKLCLIPRASEYDLVTLRGNSRACEWSRVRGTAQSGIQPASALPVLLREDFVHNANDTAWMTNPASPLVGFSPLVSREEPISLRTRFGLSRLMGERPLSEDDLAAMVTDNKVELADDLLPELLDLCTVSAGEAGLGRACKALAEWDGKANVDSGLGMFVFLQVAESFLELDEAAWSVAFDPARPLETPRGVSPLAREALHQALVSTGKLLKDLNIPADAPWGDLQKASRGSQAFSIPGGSDELGVYNAIESVFKGSRLEVVAGTSYLQLVKFTGEGPRARGILAFSQSSDPASPHYADQTVLFAKNPWLPLPFTDAEIESDPALESKVLRFR